MAESKLKTLHRGRIASAKKVNPFTKQPIYFVTKRSAVKFKLSPQQRDALAAGLATLVFAWLKLHASDIAEKVGEAAVTKMAGRLVDKLGADHGGIEVSLSKSGSLPDGTYYLEFAISNHTNMVVYPYAIRFPKLVNAQPEQLPKSIAPNATETASVKVAALDGVKCRKVYVHFDDGAVVEGPCRLRKGAP
jgi:hypothetical protein